MFSWYTDDDMNCKLFVIQLRSLVTFNAKLRLIV
ncbi:Uncharacterised protein [Vibrio cholerae]|nr:Uncharacterised protein [Vibrio cholerae]